MNGKAVEEFRGIYEKIFNERLPETEAEEKARNLLNLYKVIFQINKNENHDEQQPTQN